MAAFQTIQGKTLEQIQKNIANIAINDLRDFYNQFSGKRAIGKFSDRDTAITRVKELVDGLLAKKTESEAKNNGSKPGVSALSKAGWTALVMIRQNLKDWQSEKLTVAELAIELSIPETAVQKTVNTLENDGFLILITGEANDPDFYSLSELGKTAKEPDKKASKTQTATKARGATGPKSNLAGKKITRIATEGRKASENPSREGSKRGKAWNAIKDGMTYEKYMEAGGNAFDLGFFIMKEYITIK